jgi:hypothetical protein
MIDTDPGPLEDLRSISFFKAQEVDTLTGPQVTLAVNFTDGSTAILAAQLPEPTSGIAGIAVWIYLRGTRNRRNDRSAV